MNERVMQFRIGLFVIVSGLVLTMMVVWFGETPSLAPRPGVPQGAVCRGARGARGGPGAQERHPDRRGHGHRLRRTAQPARRRDRHPGPGAAVPGARGLRPPADPVADRRRRHRHGARQGDRLHPGRQAPDDRDVPVIEGEVAPDPSKALAAATKAFEKAGDTLAVDQRGRQRPRQAHQERRQPRPPADDLERHRHRTSRAPPRASSGSSRPTRTNFQPTSFQKFNSTLDPETQKALKDGINRFSSAAGRIDAGLADLDPAFKDLGSKVNHTPTTDIGQAVRRLNLALADLELLTSKLRNPQGGLNTDGSLQKLLVQSDLHDNLNRMAISANQAFVQLRTVLATLRSFAEKVASVRMTAGRSR